MLGQKLKLITLLCCVCQKWTALRVDSDDLERHTKQGVFVQHAFVDRDGRPYLTAAERELFLSLGAATSAGTCSARPNRWPTTDEQAEAIHGGNCWDSSCAHLASRQSSDCICLQRGRCALVADKTAFEWPA